MEANKGLYAKLVAEKADLPSKWLQQIEKVCIVFSVDHFIGYT